MADVSDEELDVANFRVVLADPLADQPLVACKPAWGKRSAELAQHMRVCKRLRALQTQAQRASDTVQVFQD